MLIESGAVEVGPGRFFGKRVLAYRQSAGINYTILMGDDNAMELAAKYGDRMDSLPYSVIISRSGSIVARKLGAFSETELAGLIEPLVIP